MVKTRLSFFSKIQEIKIQEFYYCKWVYSTGLLLGIALQKIISKDLQKQKYKAFSTYPSFSTVHCSHIDQSGHEMNNLMN